MYYNGIMMNVNSPTTTLTFTAPTLSDDVFISYTVVVYVTASGIYGIGPASEPSATVIYGMIIYNF